MKLNIDGLGLVEAVQHLGCETFTLPATGEVVKATKDPGKDLWYVDKVLYPSKKLILNTTPVVANVEPANTGVVTANSDTVGETSTESTDANSASIDANTATVDSANTEATVGESLAQHVINEISSEISAAEEQINQILHKKKKK